MGKYLLIIVSLVVLTLKAQAENAPPYFRDVKFGSGSLFTRQLAADSAGNTFWAGYFYGAYQSVGSLTFTNQNPQSRYGAFVFKLGPNMDERWGKSGGGSTSELAAYGVTGLAVDANGDCYISVWSSRNTMVFDNISYSSPSNVFTLVIKYSTDGTKIWASQLDGFSIVDADAAALCIDQESNVFLSGFKASEGYASVLQKFNSAGQPVWSRTFWPSHARVQTDLAGNCFVLASTYDPSVTFGAITLTNRGDRNYVLVKYDPSGNELWGEVGGGSAEDEGRDLAVDSNGNIYVLSSISSTNAIFGTNNFTVIKSSPFTPARFLTKYNADGTVVWASQLDPSYYSSALALDRNNNILLMADDAFSVTNGTYLGSFTPEGNLLWKKYGSSTAEDGRLEWFSRLIEVPGVGLAVAGVARSVTFDSFVCPPDLTTVFTMLSFGPYLSTARSGDLLTLSWPTNELDFLLESSEDLAATNSWTAVTNAVVVLNGQNVVSATNRFYRLRKPLP